MDDEFEMGDEFEFDMEGGEIPGMDEMSDDDREPVGSVVSDVKSALGNELELDKAANTIKSSVFRTLPANLGNRLSEVDNVASDILDGTAKTINTGRKDVANTLSGLSEILPDFLAGPISKLSSAIRPESDGFSSSGELSEDEKILADVNNTFGEQQSKEAILGNLHNVAAEYSSKQQNEILASISANTKTALDLKIEIDNKYYRKDLELQMKQTLTLVKMLGIMDRDSEIRTKQMEALVRNSALPDFVKTNGSDFVKEIMVKQASDVGLNAFKSTSVFKKASKNFTNLANDKIQSFVAGVTQLDAGIDAKKMAIEAGMSTSSMIIDNVVGAGVNKATDFVTKNTIKKLIGDNTSVQELDKLMADPEKGLEKVIADLEKDKTERLDKELTSKDKGNFFTNGVKNAKEKAYDLQIEGLKTLKESIEGSKKANSYSLEDTTKLGEAQFLDGKLKKSIEYVIPNLLSKMLGEVTTIRKKLGATEVNKDDQVIFDFNTNNFTSKKAVADKLDKSLDDKAVKLVKSISDNKPLIKALTGKSKLNDDEKRDFTKGIVEYLLKGKSTSPYYMTDDNFMDSFTNDELKTKLAKKLKRLSKPADAEAMEANEALKVLLDRIQLNEISGYKDIVDKVGKTSDISVLQEMGITDKNDSNRVSSSNISKVNKKYVNEVLDRLKDGKIEQADKFLDADGKELAGFSEGGYTGTGGKYEPAGIVHKDEFVINSDTLEDLVKDVKDKDSESILSKVEAIVSETLEKSKTTDTYKHIDSKVADIGTSITNLTDKTSEYFNNTFKDNTLDLNGLKPSTINKDSVLTNFTAKETKYKGVGDIVDSLSTDLSELVTNIKTNITDIYGDVSKDILDIKKTTTDKLTEVTKLLPKSWDDVTKMYDEGVNDISKHIPDNIKNMEMSLSGVTSVFSDGLNSLKNNIPKSFSEVNELFSDATSYGKDKIDEVYGLVPDSVKETASGFVDSTSDALNTANSDIEKVTGLNLKSKSKELYKDGSETIATFTEDATKNFNNMFNDNKTSILKTDIDNDKNNYTNFKTNNTTFTQYDPTTVTGKALNLKNNVGNTVNNFMDDNKDNSILKGLSSMFSNIEKTFSTVGSDISKNLDSNNENIKETMEKSTSIFSTLKDKLPNYDDIGSFFKSTSEFVSSIATSNDKIDTAKMTFTTKLKDGEVNFVTPSKQTNETSTFNKVFQTASTIANDGYTSIKSMISSVTDDSPEVDNNIKNISTIINNEGIDKIINDGLKETPLPENYTEAIHTYKRLFYSIDPSGDLWSKSIKDKNFIQDIEKLHIQVVNDSQKGLLIKTGEKIDQGLDKAGGMVGKLRDKVLGMIPEPIRSKIEPLLKNRFTAYAGKTVGRVKNIFKAGGKATLKELGMVGRNVKDAFIGKDGKVRLPNAIELAKLTGKTAFGTANALAVGIKDIYPQLFGVAKDTVGLATGSLWDFIGIKRAGKKLKSRLKAIVKPPIKRSLYKQWTSGKLTSAEVTNLLETEEEQIKWTKWLKENTPPGITLPEIMAKGGKWYMNTAFGLGNTVKSISENETLRKGVKGTIKGIIKGTWKFTGIPSLFGEVDENKKDPVTGKEKVPAFIDIIDEKYLKTFNETLEWINEELEVPADKILILNSPMDKLYANNKKRVIKLLQDINTLYIEMDNNVDIKLVTKIESKITTLLNYLNTIEKQKKETKPKKVNVKKTSKKKEVKDTIKPKKDSTKDTSKKSDKSKSDKKETTILDSFKESMETITEKFSTKIDDIKTSDKPKEEEFSPFDRDKDGDRDGNYKDRMAKLYGKTKTKAKTIKKSIVNKVKDKSLLSTLLMFTPLLIAGFKKMFTGVISPIIEGITKLPGLLMKGVTTLVKPMIGLLGKIGSGLLHPIDSIKNMFSDKPDAKKPNTKAKVKTKIKPKVKSKTLIGKVIRTLRVLKNKVIKKLGVKAGAKILGKITSKLIPGVGTALLAWDMGWITKYMLDGMSLKSAVSKQFTGIDLFKDDDESEAKNKEIKVNNTLPDDKTLPANNKTYSALDSNKDKVKRNVINNSKYKTVRSILDLENKPKDGTIDKVDDTVGNINMATGELYKPTGGIANLKPAKNVNIEDMNDKLKNNLFGMANEYNNLTGKRIPINSGYRSYSDQLKLKIKYGSKAATPGKSTHEYGLAFDTNTSTANELDKLGLMKKYGFTRPVGQETWHVEPSGIQFKLNEAKKDTDVANNLIDASVGRGGLGWGIKSKTRKYSRNLRYQLAAYKAKGNVVTSNNENIIKQLDTTKPIVESLNKNNKKVIATKTKTNIGENKPKTKDKIKVTTKKSNANIVVNNKPMVDSKHLKELSKNNSDTNDLLNKSIKVQYGTYNKISELVDISNSMLSVLNGKGEHIPKKENKSSKNNLYSLPSYDSLMSHSVKDY